MSEPIADRITRIRITEVHAVPLGEKAYVRVATNHGVVGWGEINNLDSRVTVRVAESLGELLIGENPTRIEHLWQRMYRAHRNLRGGPFQLHTLAALDMALWDIAGKLYGVPVFRLLGGPCRERIWIYPSGRAVKVSPGSPQPFAGTPAQIARLRERIAEARRRVGPEGAVMFDAHSALPIPLLIQFAADLAPEELLFLEEPWLPGNIDAMRKVRESVRVPLATGERDRTIWEIREILEAQVIDILQPDCGHGGGISAMRKATVLAEAHYVPIAPHCTMTLLGLTASLHVAAATPLFLIHEAYPEQSPAGLVRVDWSPDAEGYVVLPEKPGLGVEVDEAVLEQLARERRFRWPAHFHADGSVADY